MDINKISLFMYHCKNKHRYRIPLFKTLNYNNTGIFVYEHLFVIAMLNGDLKTMKFLQCKLDNGDFDWRSLLQHMKRSKLNYKGMRYIEKLCNICLHDHVHLLNVHFKGHRPFAINRFVQQEVEDYCYCVMFYKKPMNIKLIEQYLEIAGTIDEKMHIHQIIKSKCGKVFKALHKHIRRYTYKQQKYLYHDKPEHYSKLCQYACIHGDINTFKYINIEPSIANFKQAINNNRLSLCKYMYEKYKFDKFEYCANNLSYDMCTWLKDKVTMFVTHSNSINLSVYYYWTKNVCTLPRNKIVIDNISYLNEKPTIQNMVKIYRFPNEYNVLINNFNIEEQKEIVKLIIEQVKYLDNITNIITTMLLFDREQIIQWIIGFLTDAFTSLKTFHNLIVRIKLTDEEIVKIFEYIFEHNDEHHVAMIAIICDHYCIDIKVINDIPHIIPREEYGEFPDEECVVCYETSDLLTSCKHSVCETCLINCNMKCPYCRRLILSYVKKY